MNTADFFAKLRHLRTTIAGTLTIAGGLATFVAAWVKTGVPPSSEQWEILGAAVTLGSGLIASADAKTVNAEATKIKNAMAGAVSPPDQPPS